MERLEAQKNAAKEAQKTSATESKKKKKKKRRDESHDGSSESESQDSNSSNDEEDGDKKDHITTNNNNGGGGGNGADIDPLAFNSDLKSYLPKPMPSILGTRDLVKSLRAFYMLTWSRQTLRDLYGVTNVKVQDYSPNENQKVWDKVIHRRNIDINNLDKIMAYPEVDIDIEQFDDKIRGKLLVEYQKFKNQQLSGMDSAGGE